MIKVLNRIFDFNNPMKIKKESIKVRLLAIRSVSQD